SDTCSTRSRSWPGRRPSRVGKSGLPGRWMTRPCTVCEMQMTCPKCHGEMRVYERSGVTVDQCTECRGIFLDRGELEKLFEAESSYNTRRAPPQSVAPPA